MVSFLVKSPWCFLARIEAQKAVLIARLVGVARVGTEETVVVTAGNPADVGTYENIKVASRTRTGVVVLSERKATEQHREVVN
jgi:hypothetical protein